MFLCFFSLIGLLFFCKNTKNNHYTLLYMQKSIYPWQKNRNRGKMLRGARDLLKVKREKGKKSADRIFSYRHFLFVVSVAV